MRTAQNFETAQADAIENFDDVIAKLTELLSWLDANGYQLAAIDVNNAIERLLSGIHTLKTL